MSHQEPNNTDNGNNSVNVYTYNKFYLPLILILFIPTITILIISSSKKNDTTNKYSEKSINYDDVERKAIGVYRAYGESSLIIKEGGDCYIDLQDLGDKCEYDIYIPYSGDPQIDIDIISDLPGEGGGFEGVIRNNKIILSIFGDQYEYKKVR